jgi:hypothetical protein
LPNVIDEFLGIRLDDTLDQVQRRFPMRLQNTRGMTPEIYETTGVGNIDSVTMHFYNNLLKEFWIDTHERHAAPDTIERDLREKFGEPKDRALKSDKPGKEDLGLGLFTTAGDIKTDADRKKRLAAFPHRVDVSWSDDQTHTEASVYYTSEKPELCSSLLTIHISAVQWLNNNRPQLGSVATTSPTNTLDKTNEAPAPVQPPQRLFPSP